MGTAIATLDIAALQMQRLELQATANVRAREAARQLGVSEAQYVALGGADTVSRLNHHFASLLEQLTDVGELMALTRNDAMVFEHHGIYERSLYQRETLIMKSAAISLRLRLKNWAYGFKVNEKGRISLQFFNAAGQAVHKIYTTDLTDMKAFDALLKEFEMPLAQIDLGIRSNRAPSLPQAHKLLDLIALRLDWQRLNSVPHFEALLKAYKLTRPQVYQHVLEAANALEPNILKPLLTLISQQQLEVRMCVANSGAVQIHNGKINKLLEMGPWFNVLDPKFNLHAQCDLVVSNWCVYKPFDLNNIGSIEFFNQYHELLLSIELHPDVQHRRDQAAIWKDTVQSLSRVMG